MEGEEKVMNNLKYLHICTGANYVTVNGFTKLINENFDPSEHLFLISDQESNPLQKVSKYENVVFLPNADTENIEELFKYMAVCNHIFFHSMGFSWRFQKRMLKDKALMRKSTWVEWGADLFDWKTANKNKIKEIIVNGVLKSWRKNVGSVVCIFPADEKIYREQFGNKTKIFHAIYSLFYHEDMDRTRPTILKPDDNIHVLVGHSAVKNCHHFECLDSLGHFAKEKIVLHIPLTYGDMEYRDEVIEYAKKLFPEEKLDFIMDNVPLDEYVRFLWTVDIGVFKVYRQIALGNICKLLYMCKKVYLPKGSLMYDCFLDKNTEVFDFDTIKDLSFEEFSKPGSLDKPSDYMMGRMTKDRVISQWKDVFYLA